MNKPRRRDWIVTFHPSMGYEGLKALVSARTREEAIELCRTSLKDVAEVCYSRQRAGGGGVWSGRPKPRTVKRTEVLG